MSRNSKVATIDASREGDGYLLTFVRISLLHKWVTERTYVVSKHRFNQCERLVRQVAASSRQYTLLEPRTFEWN